MPISKQDTARIAVFHQLRIPFVYTLEASFCGPNQGTHANEHFSLGHLMNVGKAVLKACWAYKLKEIFGGKQALKSIQDQAESEYIQKKEDDDKDDHSSSEEEPPPPN